MPIKYTDTLNTLKEWEYSVMVHSIRLSELSVVVAAKHIIFHDSGLKPNYIVLY